MEIVSLKMEKELLQEIDSKLKNNRYATRTEFIRDAIRDKLNELEKEDVIRKLAALKGSLKGKVRMSDEKAREAVFKEFAKKFNVQLK